MCRALKGILAQNDAESQRGCAHCRLFILQADHAETTIFRPPDPSRRDDFRSAAALAVHMLARGSGSTWAACGDPIRAEFVPAGAAVAWWLIGQSVSAAAISPQT